MRFSPRLLIPLFLLFLAGCLPQIPAPAEGSLRIMTYNIHYGANVWGRFDLRGTAAVIRRSRAPVVVLQEVDRGWGKRSRYLDEPALLAVMTGRYVVFGATLDRDPEPGRGEYGLAVLSDYPIAAWEMYLLPGRLEQRGILLAWIETPQGLIPVACTHLGLSDEDRAAQAQEIAAWLPARPDLLLLGDFNSEPGAPETRAIFDTLADVGVACQVGTYYYEGAWRRIDFVFAGAAWQPLACAVLETRASDHRQAAADPGPALSIGDQEPVRAVGSATTCSGRTHLLP